MAARSAPAEPHVVLTMEGNRFRDGCRCVGWICFTGIIVVAPILESSLTEHVRVTIRNALLFAGGACFAMAAESDRRNRHDLYDHHRPAVIKELRTK